MMRNKKSPIKKILQVTILLLLVACVLLAIIETTAHVSTDNGAQDLVSRFGYVGILLIAVMAGVNIFVPVPAATFTPIFIAAGLSLPLIVLMLILGTTIADIAGYTIGRLGKEFANENYPKTYNRILYVHQKHHRLLLPLIFIYAAFIPFPNEAFLIPLALIGVRLRTFIIPLVLGTTINQLLLAYGVHNIFTMFFG